MSLDDMYGPMLEPEKPVSDHEKLCHPISLDELTQSNAPLLKAYMNSAVEGLKLPQATHKNLYLLWLITEDEKILFAAEELVDKATNAPWIFRPRVDDWKTPEDKIRIGHPSLLPNDDKRARIGGEIVYDPEERVWLINNSSGRYGDREHLTERNLDAAAGLFSRYGIDLIVEYVPPRVRQG